MQKVARTMFFLLKVGQVEGRAVNGLDAELLTTFIQNEAHQRRQGLKMSRDVQQRIHTWMVNSADPAVRSPAVQKASTRYLLSNCSNLSLTLWPLGC